MRDYRKFCRPITTKSPQIGDIEVKLKCGTTVYVKAKDYKIVERFFKINSIIGEKTNSSGNIKVLSKDLDKEMFISSSDYINNLDKFELIEIVGERKDPFGLYEYVDLGLPSGTLWCKTNVGAASEEAIGNYYKFGETTIYDGSDYNTSAYSDVYDPNIDLPLEYDAANVNQGGNWHIPTKAQWDELINNTTHTYISDYNGSGVSAIKFEKTNDSSTFIIIPTGGSYTDGVQKHPEIAYYWTKTVDHTGSVYYPILTENSYFFTDWSTAFGHGHLVRAVCDSIDSQGLAEEGDIIAHNNNLSKDAIFSYEDWVNLDDSWDLVGLYGITTYEEEDASNGDYVILANGHTLIIKSEDYSKVNNHWEHVDTINLSNYDYVEIGGLKWATMNIGASQPSDYGLYFAWGDTQGYTAEQVGSGEGQKYFGWADYKYGNGTSSPGATGMTKYNATDGLTTLEAADDAAVANWGGSWRMPTTAEFQALGAAVNTAWTQVNNVYGILCTDKTDSSKTLFFPAAGRCLDGSVSDVGNYGRYWSSSLGASRGQGACNLDFSSSNASWDSSSSRCYGYPVRCVLDE